MCVRAVRVGPQTCTLVKPGPRFGGYSSKGCNVCVLLHRNNASFAFVDIYFPRFLFCPKVTDFTASGKLLEQAYA